MKTQKKQLIIVILVSLIALLTQPLNLHSQTLPDSVSGVLKSKAPDFPRQNMKLEDVVTLMSEHGIRMCTETGRDSVSILDTLLTIQQDRLFTITDVLDSIVHQLGNYAWENISGTNMITIFPKQGSLLDYRIKRIDIVDKALDSALRKDDALELNSQPKAPIGLGYYYRGNFVPVSTHVNLKMNNVSARVAMSKLVYQVRGMVWTLHRMTPKVYGLTVYIPRQQILP